METPYSILLTNIQKAVKKLEDKTPEPHRKIVHQYEHAFVNKIFAYTQQHTTAATDEVAYQRLIHHIYTDTQKTLSHNSPLGTYRGAKTIERIIKHYI